MRCVKKHGEGLPCNTHIISPSYVDGYIASLTYNFADTRYEEVTALCTHRAVSLSFEGIFFV